MTDRELLDLYANREPGATAAMQQQYGGYCAAIVGLILTDPWDVEECLNDLWMRVWMALQEQHQTCLKGWLGAAARNCAIDSCRRRSTIPAAVLVPWVLIMRAARCCSKRRRPI